MIDQGNPRFIRSLEISQRVAGIRNRLGDPDTGPDELAGLIEEQQALEEELRRLLEADLHGLAEAAEDVATMLHTGIAEKLLEADRELGALRALAKAVEAWSDLTDTETRVGFGVDLVDAARQDVRRVMVPLPVLEVFDRRKKND